MMRFLCDSVGERTFLTSRPPARIFPTWCETSNGPKEKNSDRKFIHKSRRRYAAYLQSGGNRNQFGSKRRIKTVTSEDGKYSSLHRTWDLNKYLRIKIVGK